VGIVANQAGITLHNAQLYEQSRQMAEKDRQLNILNQTSFIQQSQRILARARINNRQAALLLGDIDDFRRVNNTYGHQTGDVVLANVAALMKQVVGDAGIVGRWGGEEFVILLPNVNEQQAMDTAEEIRRRVEQSVFESDEGQDVRATISTGVALFPRDGGDFVWLHKQADRAAYLAKRMGKNRVCLYEDRKESIEARSTSEPNALQAVVHE
jgi:diguanylate cyclase (GGDEF)-like protein